MELEEWKLIENYENYKISKNGVIIKIETNTILK
jgi:hypothetical protein